MPKSARLTKLTLVALCCCLCLGVWGGQRAQAAEVSASYMYSFWGEAVAAPAAYQATDLHDGQSLGLGAFKEPNDLYVRADGTIYILDSGNNRVVRLDERLEPIDVIDGFVNGGAQEGFANPQGLFVTETGHLYIADTGNRRVVHLDENDELVKIIDSPESELLQANFVFQPMRLVVDNSERVYVMAAGVFDGFMEFNSDGTFSTFIGANRVYVDPVEYLWKMLATRQQRSQMVMFTPTEFTSLDINEEGFIYATNGDRFGDPIKKLNAQGTDILRREGMDSPMGDLLYTSSTGPSRLIDIDVGDSEMYSVLDAKLGRIFTYNGDGHLMYIFGGLGNRLGEFNTPIAITRSGDDILVLDKALGEITRFQTTEYGRVLNEAVRSYYRGNEAEAAQYFYEAINLNANLEYAYAGIGKAELRQGNYSDAVHYFRQSMDHGNYSKAFQLLRKEVLREHFSVIMSGIVLAVVLLVLVSRYRKMKARKKVVSV
ncbi:NHL repeat-containing protein [Paenibacillus daejeonensis]|uniref:NHL repeat-containing protein n=1 Tax=Paenibacillus daejeonensis TaxID=135193 RepID=UPI0003690AE3|nr:NHL repeat-containing protein [Paenibacillus daejeonensis]